MRSRPRHRCRSRRPRGARGSPVEVLLFSLLPLTSTQKEVLYLRHYHERVKELMGEQCPLSWDQLMAGVLSGSVTVPARRTVVSSPTVWSGPAKTVGAMFAGAGGGESDPPSLQALNAISAAPRARFARVCRMETLPFVEFERAEE